MKNADSRAFPTDPSSYGGLTKREYFAGLALQGILAAASSNIPDEATAKSFVARVSVEMADALLKALES